MAASIPARRRRARPFPNHSRRSRHCVQNHQMNQKVIVAGVGTVPFAKPGASESCVITLDRAD